MDSADHTSTKSAAGKGTDHTFQTEREPSRGTLRSSTHHYWKRERIGRSDPSESSSEDESHNAPHKRKKTDVVNEDLTTPFDPSKEKESKSSHLQHPR